MAYARFFRLLALLSLAVFVALGAAWATRDWLPTAVGELAALQAARDAMTALARDPLDTVLAAWSRRGIAGPLPLLGALPTLLGDARAPLLALCLPLIALAWAAFDGARHVARRLPAAGAGSVVEVERRLGVGRRAALLQQDAQDAAAWRAVMLALLPAAAALAFRHWSHAPFAAAAAAVAAALLVRSDGFRRRLPSVGWALAAALCLHFDPAVAAIALAGPPVAALAEHKDLRARLAHAGVALAVLAAFATPALLALPRAAFLVRVPDAAGLLYSLGLPAALLLLLGALGLALGRPGRDPALRVWLGALLSAIVLPFLVGGAQAAHALFLVAPLAVLGAVGWSRSRVLTSPAGTTLLAVGAFAAALFHAQGAGLLPLPLGPLTPAPEGPRPAHAAVDREVLGWLAAPGGAVLDLPRTPDGWGGAWLRYLAAVEAPGAALDWPLDDVAGPFVEAPCLLDHVVVIHSSDPWFDADQVAVAAARLAAPAQAELRDALALARLCYRADRVEEAPGGARLTYLARRAALADLLRGAGAADALP